MESRSFNTSKNDSLGIMLLAEDSKADIRLVMEALRDVNATGSVHVVEDGEAAMDYLHQCIQTPSIERPGLVLLDLNLPKKKGLQVLSEMKSDEALRRIPVVILTSSRNEDDVRAAYDLGANCYVSKPMDFDGFESAIRLIVEFWMQVAVLPRDL